MANIYRLRTSATFNNSGGTNNYDGLINKPKINNVELSGNKSSSDLGLQPAGNYLTEVPSDYKTKAQNDELYQPKGSYLTTESDPIFSASAASLIQTSDITNWNNKVDANVNNLTNYTLATDTGSTIELSINSSTYVVTLNLKNSAGTTISTDTIDLPLESVVVSGSYDSTHKKIVLTLQSGSTIDIPVGDLISGLQTEITSNNKLSSDLVDDANKTHKFVSASDKAAWNAKYDKPSSGIPSTDLSSAVQTSLGKANTAIQDVSDKQDVIQYSTMPTASASNLGKIIQFTGTTTSTYTNGYFYKCTSSGSPATYSWTNIQTMPHQDITGKLDTNKVKSATSTTAGDVYDVTYINTMLGNIETVLTTITTGGGVN